MNKRHIKTSLTRNIPKPTEYVLAIDGEYKEWAYNEERAIENKGLWRESAFGVARETPLDLEIGTGNGFFFSERAARKPERLLLGVEIKYKPLIQTIRRARKLGSDNAKILRYNANYPEDLFFEGELNDVFIHFPDPWTKKTKKRLLNGLFLEKLYKLQKTGSLLEFKTDSRDYFDEAVQCFKNSPYKVVFLTYDLHNSEIKEGLFKTHFEQIFMKQNLPIHYISLQKLTAPKANSLV